VANVLKYRSAYWARWLGHGGIAAAAAAAGVSRQMVGLRRRAEPRIGELTHNVRLRVAVGAHGADGPAPVCPETQIPLL